MSSKQFISIKNPTGTTLLRLMWFHVLVCTMQRMICLRRPLFISNAL